MTVMEGCDEIVREFLVESYENLDQLDQDLVALEKDPGNRDILASIFRTIHTIKGTCGFLGFGKLEKVAHVGENLLSKLRDGELELDSERTSALLSMLDAIRQILASIEAEENEGDVDYSELIALLERLQMPADEEDAAKESGAAPDGAAEAADGEGEPTEIEDFGSILLARGEVTPEQLERAAKAQADGDPRRIGEILVEQGAIAGREVKDALTKQTEQRTTAASSSNLSESTIRVDVEHLDKLMNLVGELVLARNQILQHATGREDAAFVATSQRLNLITTELQEGVMKTRMQPIGNVWNKLPRVVRDLSRSCGKQVKVVMEGKETELDKTIIEAIRDPLTHLVRNSVDHGIEDPAARAKLGKPAEGVLLLRAFHEGGQVNIEIIDDGSGIDTEALKSKALERSLISPDQAARMGERELLNLIFMPGFSTAKTVTNVSGRGVGMDVVRTNIEKIGGTIDLQSTRGEGTTFKIKIPLTLAIIPALIVSDASERYAIPQVNLLELVRLEGEQARSGIEEIHGAPVYRLRGNLLPLVFLHKELGLEGEADEAGEDGAVSIVVLQADEQQFGLVVSEINDTEEIVVKPLSKQLKHIQSYAGATIMGDGRVALILDVLGLAQRAGVISEITDAKFTGKDDVSEEELGERETLLVFSIGSGRRVAMPLSLVARLEEFSEDRIEVTGDREVVQYRGEIMPLTRLSGFFGTEAARVEDGLLQVVVYTERGRSIGLVVEEILDIVDARLTVQSKAREQPGIVGAAVVQDKVTDLLDVRGVVTAAVSDFFDAAEDTEESAPAVGAEVER